MTLSSSAECSSAVPKATARAKCSGKATLNPCPCLSSWVCVTELQLRDTAHTSSGFSTAQNGAQAPYSKLGEGIKLTLPETPTLLIPTHRNLQGLKLRRLEAISKTPD